MAHLEGPRHPVNFNHQEIRERYYQIKHTSNAFMETSKNDYAYFRLCKVVSKLLKKFVAFLATRRIDMT
jgi:hypothetical protein